ncbi:hypothetical protein [Nocardia sp. NPDC004711]
MNVKALSHKGLSTLAMASAAAAGLLVGAAPASANLVSAQAYCHVSDVGGCWGAYITVQATTSTPVTIVANGVTLGGSPFALKPCCNGVNGANYGVTVQLNLVDGDQHIVVYQKNADGTTSQQSTDYRYNGTTGSSSTGLLPMNSSGSSAIANPIEAILNGFQTGSTGGHVVSQ